MGPPRMCLSDTIHRSTDDVGSTDNGGAGGHDTLSVSSLLFGLNVSRRQDTLSVSSLLFGFHVSRRLDTLAVFSLSFGLHVSRRHDTPLCLFTFIWTSCLTST
jgi:hypothetical protein